MKLNITPILTNTELSILVEAACNAEAFREVTKLQEILQPVWADIEEEPDYGKYDLPDQAELLRLSGAFLTLYAGARGLKNIHLRAKNLLTRSIEIFERLELREKIAEANLWLGFAYGNCGETEDYEAVYNCIETEFGNRSEAHRIYLLVIINRLVICINKNQTDIAEKLIESNLEVFESITDIRLQAMFHNNAGIIFMFGNNYPAAVRYFNRAAALAKELKISDFEARIYNNLAHLYSKESKFTEAHEHAQKSLQIFIAAGITAGIPIILDTKALIYLAEEKFELALQTVDSAIERFRKGEDAVALTDAYWTKTLCLLQMRRIVDALLIFTELQTIAAAQIGSDAVKKFVNLLKDEIYLPPKLPLLADVAAYRKFRVKKGLIKSNLKMTKAAKILGLKSHENLRRILLKQFPEIYEELKMPRPKTRRSKKQKFDPPSQYDNFFRSPDPELPAGSRTVILKPEQIHEEKVISKIKFQNVIFSFDFDYDLEIPKPFYFDEYLMSEFGVSSDAVVAVAPLVALQPGEIILIMHENQFVVGRVKHSALENIYFLDDERFGWIPLDLEIDAEKIIGVPVAYCPFSEAGNKLVAFKKLAL